jgi:hypothetical protein
LFKRKKSFPRVQRLKAKTSLNLAVSSCIPKHWRFGNIVAVAIRIAG